MKKNFYPSILRIFFFASFLFLYFSGKSQDVTAPSIPQNLHIVSLDHYHLTIAWNASTDNVGGSGLKGYPIGTGATIIGGADKYSNTNSFTINFNAVWWNLSTQNLIIAIQAEDNAGNISAFSTYLPFTIPPAPDVTAPSIPQNLRIVSLDHFHLTIAWDASTDNVGGSGMKGYPIGTGQTVIGGADKYSNTNTFTINFNAAWWAFASQSFIIAAKAEDNAGNISAFSNQLAFTIPPAPVVPDTQSPTAPTNLSVASHTAQNLNLQWTASTDNIAVTRYVVYVSKTNDFSPAPPPTEFNSNTTNISIPAYTYEVKIFVAAFDAAGNRSNSSNEIIVPALVINIPDTQAPTTPTGLTGAATTTGVNLNWNTSTDNVGVVGYEITAVPTGILPSPLPPPTIYTSTTNSYAVTPAITAGMKYSVRAKDAAGNYSGYSDLITVLPPVVADVIAPSIPQNLRIISLDHFHLTIAWDASTDNVGGSGMKGYPIGTGQTVIGGADKYSNTNSYTINFNAAWWAFASQSFIIAAKAEDNAGNISAFSTQLSFTIPAAPFLDTEAPTTPTGFAGTATNTSMTLNWNASTDNVGVVLYEISSIPNGLFNPPPATIYTTTATTYTINQTFVNLGLILYIRAKDAAGNYSPYSASITVNPSTPVIPDTQAPTTPTGLTGAATTTGVNLNWNTSTDNVGVVGYEITAVPTGILPSPLPPPTIYTSTTNSYTVTPAITAGMKYSVRAKDAAGNYSAYSDLITVLPPVVADVIAPSIPQNLRIISLDHFHLTIAWDASTDNVGGSGMKGYPIGTGQTVIGGADKYSNTNSYTINFNAAWWAFASQSFIIAAKAEDNAGNISAFSTQLAFTIPPAPVVPDTQSPSAPTNLSVASHTAQNLNLQWTASTDNIAVTRYVVYVSKTNDFSPAPPPTEFNSNTTNISIPAYTYEVKIFVAAFDAAGNRSNSSNEIIVPALPAVPVTPITFIANITTAVQGTAINFTFVGTDLPNASFTAWSWYFSDNANVASTLRNPVHTFTQPGVYSVYLSARRSNGTVDSVVKINYITITAAPFTDILPPTVPTNLRIVSLTEQAVTITWDASTDNVAVAKYMKSTCQTVCGTVDDSTTANTYTINFSQPWYDLPGRYFKIAMAAKDAAGNVSALSSYLRIDIPLNPSQMKPDLTARLALETGQLLYTPFTPVFVLTLYNVGNKNIVGGSTSFDFIYQNNIFQASHFASNINLNVGDSVQYRLVGVMPIENPIAFKVKVLVNDKTLRSVFIEESNYNNNTTNELSINVTNPPVNFLKPDLVIDKVTTNTTTGLEGRDKISGTVIIKNVGGGVVNAGKRIKVLLRFSTSSYNEQSVDADISDYILTAPLLPNQTITLSYETNVCYSIGNVKCIGWVDNDNYVQEENENNNYKEINNFIYFTKNYDLSNNKPNYHIFNSTITHKNRNGNPAELQVGDSIKIVFHLLNFGNRFAPSTYCNYKFSYGGQTYDSRRFVPILMPGDSTDLVFNVLAVQNANAFVLTIDTENDLYEVDENDNVYVTQYVMPKNAQAPIRISNFLNGDNLYVTLPNETDNNSVVTLRNMQGMLLRSFNYTGNKTFNWNVGDVVMGTYFITISINHRPFTQQIMLVK